MSCRLGGDQTWGEGGISSGPRGSEWNKHPTPVEKPVALQYRASLGHHSSSSAVLLTHTLKGTGAPLLPRHLWYSGRK